MPYIYQKQHDISILKIQPFTHSFGVALICD
jgi:hypothetical protein